MKRLQGALLFMTSYYCWLITPGTQTVSSPTKLILDISELYLLIAWVNKPAETQLRCQCTCNMLHFQTLLSANSQFCATKPQNSLPPSCGALVLMAVKLPRSRWFTP